MDSLTTTTEQRYDLFLKRVGWLFVVCSLLGFMALGPVANNSLLGRYLSLDVNQSLIHLVLGIVALVVFAKGSTMVQRYMAALIGVLAIIATAYSIYRYDFPAPNAMVINIETPWESLFYLLVGLWALWVVLMPAGPLFVKDQQ